MPNNLNYEFSLINKFFDYIKAGIPVVSSHLIEIRKLVEQFNCGAMTTSHDPHDILDALQYAFKNKSSFKKGILQAKEELVWEKEVINLINCYKPLQKQLHIVSFDVPFPANYGGVIDVFYKIKSLHQEGVGVILHCFHYGRKKSEVLESLCEKSLLLPEKNELVRCFSRTPFIVCSRKTRS